MNFSTMMLGTAQFGMNYGVANTNGKPTRETVREIIGTAFENGVNCLDTAPAYGDSETIIGETLADLGLAGKMRVVSKVKIPEELTVGERKAFVTESVENSLRRLRLERLDVCLLHNEDDLRYFDILQRLEQRGLIDGTGVSLDSNRHCREVIDRKLQYLQLPYNILDHRYDEFFDALPEIDRPTIFARSAYLQGLLLMPEERVNPALSRIIPVRRAVADLATAADMDMPELCLRFVLSNTRISSVLVGVDSPAQLKSNIAIIRKGALPSEMVRNIRAVVPRLDETVIRPASWPAR